MSTRLQSSSASSSKMARTQSDIKPIALTMSEQAPCVPLKLTSIAATPEMPILVCGSLARTRGAQSYPHSS